MQLVRMMVGLHHHARPYRVRRWRWGKHSSYINTTADDIANAVTPALPLSSMTRRTAVKRRRLLGLASVPNRPTTTATTRTSFEPQRRSVSIGNCVANWRPHFANRQSQFVKIAHWRSCRSPVHKHGPSKHDGYVTISRRRSRSFSYH